MAWCPKCKNEYREGFTVCADCGVQLVESLDDGDMVPLIFGKNERLVRLKEFLEYSGITKVEMKYDEAEGVYEVFVSKKEKKQADTYAKLFMMKQTEMMMKMQSEAVDDKQQVDIKIPEIEHAEPKMKKVPMTGRYQSNAAKAEDNKVSAWTLLLIGFLGLIFIILAIAGIIPISFGNPYVFYGVMGAIFVLFIIMGFVSMKSARVYSEQAVTEKDKQREVLQWCKDNLSADAIDGELYMQDAPEEVLYFKRFEKMKKILSNEFPELDLEFLEQFIDETVYEMVFPEK